MLTHVHNSSQTPKLKIHGEKGKGDTVLNQAPIHADIQKWKYNSSHCFSRHLMTLNGKCYAFAARDTALSPLCRILRGPQSFCTQWRTKKSLSLPRTEMQFYFSLASSLHCIQRLNYADTFNTVFKQIKSKYNYSVIIHIKEIHTSRI